MNFIVKINITSDCILLFVDTNNIRIRYYYHKRNTMDENKWNDKDMILEEELMILFHFNEIGRNMKTVNIMK